MRAQHGVGHGVDAEPPSCARRRACPSLPERYPATPLRVRPRTPRTAASPLTTCRHLSSNCGQARPCAGYHVTRSGSSRQKSAGPDSRRQPQWVDRCHYAISTQMAPSACRFSKPAVRVSARTRPWWSFLGGRYTRIRRECEKCSRWAGAEAAFPMTSRFLSRVIHSNVYPVD